MAKTAELLLKSSQQLNAPNNFNNTNAVDELGNFLKASENNSKSTNFNSLSFLSLSASNTPQSLVSSQNSTPSSTGAALSNSDRMLAKLQKSSINANGHLLPQQFVNRVPQSLMLMDKLASPGFNPIPMQMATSSYNKIYPESSSMMNNPVTLQNTNINNLKSKSCLDIFNQSDDIKS